MSRLDNKGLSIFYRLLIAFLAVVSFLSISLTVGYYFFSKKSIEQQFRESIAAKLGEIDYNFEQSLKDLSIRDLQVLAANPVLNLYLMSSDLDREINARALERLFLQSLRYMKNIQSISFVDYLGKEKIRVNRAGRLRTYRDFQSDTLFKQVESSPADSIHCKGPFRAADGNHLFSLAIHKTDPDIGEFSGAVIVEYSLQSFFSFLEKSSLLSINPVWILAPDGHVLLHPSETEVFLDPRPYLAEGLQDVPFLLTTKDGLISYTDLSVITGSPLLRICLSIPSAVLLKDSNAVLRFLLLVTLCASLAVIVLVFFISRYLSKPIVDLAHAVTNISKGNIPSQVKTVASGEVKMLVDGFNKMALDLQKTTVSKDYVDNIIQTMTNTLVVISPEGIIKTVNSATCTLLGYTEHELIDKSLSTLFAEETFQAGFSQVLGKGDIINQEVLYLSKGGEKIPVLFSSRIMEKTGTDYHNIVCLAQDITELKKAEHERERLEEHLRQSHKMEAIGTLAGGIAHDFNNILTGILGFAELAKCEIPADSKAQSDVEQIITSGKRASELVKQMLTFSRREKMERMATPLNIHTKEILKLLRATIPSTIEIRQNIDAECHDILANPTEVHQLIMNLCTNASHAMEKEGGILEIGVRDVIVGPDQVSDNPKLSPGLYIMLTVKDTGQGIDPSVYDRIFDPFFTTKGVGKGTGMGLAVVHGIVESCKGVISVDSDPATGTTFTILFPPAKKKEFFLEQNPATTPLATGQERILLVDDEEIILTVQKRGLEQHGYTVSAVTSSVEALHLFRSNPDSYDIVITDYTMPQMTGEGLARELHKIRAGLPIILCTGYSRNVTESEAKEIGIREFVMKPVVALELANIIRKIFDE